MTRDFLFAAFALAVAASPAMAANARSPYANIDRRTDAGNDTGNSRVDELNRAQLDQNYYNRAPGPGGPGYPQPGYAPPPAYAPPPYYGR